MTLPGGIVHVEVRRGCSAIGLGDQPEVDLDAVASGEPVFVASLVFPHGEAELGVEGQRRVNVAHGEAGRDPMEAAAQARAELDVVR
jgi:hypothetical protein